MKKLALLACMSPNRVIGNKGKLPWKIPEDLKYFKSQTKNKVLIAGVRTYNTLPHRVFKENDVFGVNSPDTFEAALAWAYDLTDEPIVIGGGYVYGLAMPLATRVDLTVLKDTYEGDTLFPEMGDWRPSVVEPVNYGTRYMYVRNS